MGFKWQQLGQVRPDDTSFNSLYSPFTTRHTLVKELHIHNKGAGAANVRVCVDQDNNTASEATALLWDVPIPAGGPTLIVTDLHIPMNDSSGEIRVLTDVSDDVIFTAYGDYFFTTDLHDGVLYKEFFQIRPNVNTFVNLTGPNGLNPIDSGMTGLITDIIMTNTHATNNVTAQLAHDSDGETFGDDQLIWGDDIFKGDFIHLKNLRIGIDDVGGLAIKTPTINSVTITAYGILFPTRGI